MSTSPTSMWKNVIYVTLQTTLKNCLKLQHQLLKTTIKTALNSILSEAGHY